MLTCVYHPIDPMRVVEDDEADLLKASGCWFDSPKTAKEYRNKVEKEIQEEQSMAEEAVPPKTKSRGKTNERQ